jgi:predicted esterase
VHREKSILPSPSRLGLSLLIVTLVLLAPSPVFADANPAVPRGPSWVYGAHDIEVLVYPPRSRRGPQPIFVMLHGMCDEPQNECPYFAQSVTKRGWLLCPRARLRCRGGGSIWSYARRQETVRESVRAVQAAFPGLLDESSGKTLIGFSLGGLFGMDLAHRGADDYRRVVLIGARVYPSARLLRAAGVQRLVLAAGEHDMMHWHMLDQARRVGRQGVDARFVSLGDAGHWFPPDLTERMDAILDWVATE